jgi:hypothetical protein
VVRDFEDDDHKAFLRLGDEDSGLVVSREAFQRAGSTTVEIDASHAVTVSRPDAIAELIDEAARATTS